MNTLRKLSDKDLLGLLGQNSIPAFEELYNRHWKLVYNAAFKRIDSQETAEEIVQDIFTSLWVKRGQLVIHTSITQYLLGSVRFQVYNHYEKERVRSAYRETLTLSGSEYDNSTEEAILVKDMRKSIAKQVEILPAKCRSVFELSRHEHKNNREIAQLLDISEKTVENHLTKALKILRLNLKDVITALIACITFLH